MRSKEGRSHLQVDHVPGKRDLRVLSRVHDRDVGLLYFFFHKPCDEEETMDSDGCALGRWLPSAETSVTLCDHQQTVDRWEGAGSHSLSLRSISSHRRTSLTNLRWKTLTSGFSCKRDSREHE